MNLNADDVRALLRATLETREVEIDCAACWSHVAAYAEREISGKELGEALRVVDEHLAGCPDCREEYEALRAALLSGGAPGSPGRPPSRHRLL